jgi:competence protein ComEC
MPFWDRDLDLLVMTHPDSDHVTGLVAVLDRYRVGGWLDAGPPVDDALYAECRARLTMAGVPVRVVAAGDRLAIPVPGGAASLAGEAIAIEVLHPPSGGLAGGEDADNENSVVLRVSWGASSFLLTGDASARAEALLLAADAPLAATVLKAGHHGSAGATTAPFLAAVDPAFAVISAGAGNEFGHPSPEVLERLEAQGGITVLRTGEVGTIEFVTDGRLLWVETERASFQ